MAGEAEYTFWHALTRDVAYAGLPRASRASRHLGVAQWLESKSPDRLGDLADVLAHHYNTALDLARAAGQTAWAAELETPALRYLLLAGERAMGLDTAAAVTSFERALALTPPGHPRRLETLPRFGEAAFQAGRLDDATEALDEASAGLLEKGDVAAVSRAMAALGEVLYSRGDPRWSSLAHQALALLEPRPPGPELVVALTELSRAESLQGRNAAAIRYAEHALQLAVELGLPRSARTLGYRGQARVVFGDRRGLDDIGEAIAIGTAAGQGRQVALLHNSLSYALWGFEGPAASLEVVREGVAFAEARGLTEMATSLTAGSLDQLVECGELDQALDTAADLAGRLEGVDALDLADVRATRVVIAVLRGSGTELPGMLEWLEATCREVGAVDWVPFGLALCARVRAELGQGDAASALLSEVLATPGARESLNFVAALPSMVRTSLALGDRALSERLVSGFEPRQPYGEHALVAAHAALAEASGDLAAAIPAYADAADRWERFGVVAEQGFALLGQGRCLLAVGETEAGSVCLRESRRIWERLGATPRIAEIDTLVQRLRTKLPS